MAQFTLYMHTTGPNGWKVVALLKALGLTYESKYLDFSKLEHKAPSYIALNPNGRIPTLIDHSKGDLTISESDAILLYLVDTYDEKKQFTVTGTADKAHLLQYLFFQASGQGPYYGQSVIFMKFAPEKIPYAITRYVNEIKRVMGVIELLIKGKQWLLEDKVTIADLSFWPWDMIALNVVLKEVEPDFDASKEFPQFYKWHQAILELPYVKATIEEKAAVTAPAPK